MADAADSALVHRVLLREATKAGTVEKPWEIHGNCRNSWENVGEEWRKYMEKSGKMIEIIDFDMGKLWRRVENQ